MSLIANQAFSIFIYTPCHMNHKWYLCPFLTLLHWKSNTILHYKVNGPCFIFSPDNLIEWILLWLSLWKFNITWLPSLLIMGRWDVYSAPNKFAYTFLTTTSYLSDVCFELNIWQGCLALSPSLSLFIYLPVDIKKNSKDIRPNAPMRHFRHEQWSKGSCCIFWDMWIYT